MGTKRKGCDASRQELGSGLCICVVWAGPAPKAGERSVLHFMLSLSAHGYNAHRNSKNSSEGTKIGYN